MDENELTEEQKNRLDDVKKMFSDAYNFIDDTCSRNHETQMALDKLEEARDWAVKSIKREEK